MEGFKIINKVDLGRPVLTLKLLKDKRLAVGNEFFKLNIYDLTSYKPDIIIENEFEDFITNINQLANDDLIVTAKKAVKIIKITKTSYSVIQKFELTGGIFDMGYGSGGIYMVCNKIIELSNNDLAICIRYHNLIQLWKKKDGNYFKYDNLIEKERSINEIFEIRPNYLLSDNKHYKHLVIWDLENKKIITILKKIFVDDIISDNKTSVLNEKTIAYCGSSHLYIIEKHKFCVIQEIKCEKNLVSICLFSKNILFVGDYKGLLYQYEIEGSNIKIKDKKLFKYEEICSIQKIDENRLAMGFGENILLFLGKK